MTLFVRQRLVFNTSISLTVLQCHAIISCRFTTIIRCLVIHTLLQGVAGRVILCSLQGCVFTVVLVLHTLRLLRTIFTLTVLRVYKQVEGIVVEGELRAVFGRHRTPGN